MNTSVDNVELLAYQHQIDDLVRQVQAQRERIDQLEEARQTALQYAERLGYLCSTLTEESLDLQIATDAILHVLKSV